jgi:uncharacterized protein YbjT (DUF2867 family)
MVAGGNCPETINSMMMQHSQHANTKPVIGLTGATGYVGGRLLTRLQNSGYPVACMTRRPENLSHRKQPGTEIRHGDVMDAASLETALAQVEVAFYLVHRLGDRVDFEEMEARGAEHFAAAAKKNGVKKIIYLSGLGRDGPDLSPHLRSRHRVGELLRASGIPVIELRASIILGSGSLSYEMIRSLVERLPVMICPRWVGTPTQPISIEDVLDYLMHSIPLASSENRVYEIGGPEPTSYGGIMMEYARQRGLKRRMIPVPLLTPRLSSLWLGLVTPVYARTGRKLVEGLKNPTVVEDPRALNDFPIRPMSLADALERARIFEDREMAETHWFEAVSSAGRLPSWGGKRYGSRLVDFRETYLPVTPEEAFHVVRSIGGKNGWYFADWLWKIRGAIDLLVGGVGLRRGRRHPTDLRVGDPVDFWRVESFEPNAALRLRAEMRLPGRAWLEFEVEKAENGCYLRQTAVFDPLGLGGVAYWYGIYPLHAMVFRGMLRGIAKEAIQSR